MLTVARATQAAYVVRVWSKLSDEQIQGEISSVDVLVTVRL